MTNEEATAELTVATIGAWGVLGALDEALERGEGVTLSAADVVALSNLMKITANELTVYKLADAIFERLT